MIKSKNGPHQPQIVEECISDYLNAGVGTGGLRAATDYVDSCATPLRRKCIDVSSKSQISPFQLAGIPEDMRDRMIDDIKARMAQEIGLDMLAHGLIDIQEVVRPDGKMILPANARVLEN